MTQATRIATMVLVTLSAASCDDDNGRIAEMATEQAERQAQQSRDLIELQHTLAEGSRELIESDGRAREAIAEIHQDLQRERAECGRQRDLLEEERRQLATQRYRDPIVAESIRQAGLLLACLLPLALAAYLLRLGSGGECRDEVGDLLLQDMWADQPLLFPPPDACPEEPLRISVQSSRDNDNEPTGGLPVP